MSYIAKFLNIETNEYALNEDGCTYANDEEERLEFIHIELMKFCGCGRPDDAMAYLRDALAYVDLRKDSPDYFKDKSEWEKWHKGWKAKREILFPDERAFWFMMYFLDREELEEHGGATPGWLTDKGKGLLEDLIELLGPVSWKWEAVIMSQSLNDNEHFVERLHAIEEFAQRLKNNGEIPPHHPALVKLIKDLQAQGLLSDNQAKVVTLTDPLYKLAENGKRWDVRQY